MRYLISLLSLVALMMSTSLVSAATVAIDTKPVKKTEAKAPAKKVEAKKETPKKTEAKKEEPKKVTTMKKEEKKPEMKKDMTPAKTPEKKVEAKKEEPKKTVAKEKPKKVTTPAKTTPKPVVSVAHTYITGPEGGCYYINSNKNKTYVEKTFCKK
jgi:outer membrane biosynthesis protein TonB